jgi:hypothetical protein
MCSACLTNTVPSCSRDRTSYNYLGFSTSGPSRCKISTGRAQIPFSLESIRAARPALPMSVPRGRPEVGARGQSDAIDPGRTFVRFYFLAIAFVINSAPM